MAELRWVESPKGAVALDDRTFPVLFATWTGHAEEKTVRAFYAWNDVQLKRVTAEGAVFSLITDAIAAERPDAAIRALLAELTRSMQQAHPAVEALRVSS